VRGVFLLTEGWHIHRVVFLQSVIWGLVAIVLTQTEGSTFSLALRILALSRSLHVQLHVSDNNNMNVDSS